MFLSNSSQTKSRFVSVSFHLVRWIGLPVIVLSIQAQAVQAQFRELISRVPSGANAVVLLNVEKAKDSPFGVQQGWKENLERAFDAGMARVPPQATRFVLATQMDLEFMESVWEVAVISASETLTVARIAEERSGTLDSVENLPAALLPNDTYVVQFGPGTFGAMAPANRQAVLRWIRELQTRSNSALSPYLRRAAGYSDDAGTEIIMAIDLEGGLLEKGVYEYLKATPLLEGSNVDREKLAGLLAGVQGVRVGIRLGEKPFGKIVVDFADDVSIAEPFAKPLLLDILAGAGASIHDLAQWRPATQGKEISLEGYLSIDGMRRLQSLIGSPAPATSAPEQTTQHVSPGDLPAMKAQASLDRFKAVTAMFRDLRYDWDNLKSLSAASLYFDKYAKRIERLPLLNVDPDLLDYSDYVAQQLRAASGSVRTMGIRGGVRQAQITSADSAPYSYGGYRYGRYGRYGGYAGGGGYAVYDPHAEMKNIDTQRRVVRTEERGKMASDVWTIRDQVIAATNDVRREMTQRYQVEF